MTNKSQGSKGFTLIELLLALAFISFLLLFVVSAMLQITRMYSKGSAIRQINQTGRQLVESLGSTMRYSAPIYTDLAGTTTYKRLCAGGTSYVWNITGQPATDYVNKLDTGAPVGFVSVQDPTASLCNVSPAPASVPSAQAVDLLGNSITPLKMSVSQHGSLWDVLVVLSTAGSNVATPNATTPTGFSCDPNNPFCAFGDFETSIYMRGN